MRKRRNILNRGDPDARALQGGYGRLATRTGALHPDLELYNTGLLGGVGALLSGSLSGKGSALARPLEANSARRVPTQGFAICVRNRYQGIIEGRLDVRDSLAYITPDSSLGYLSGHLLILE